MKITFINTENIDEKYIPIPSSDSLPEWYKNTMSYIDGKKKPNGNGETTATIKKCIPVFDAISAGYLILSPADIYVSKKDGMVWYEWAAGFKVEFHPVEQALNHPERKDAPYPKWVNPWGIKTPSGYSCLFTQPMHRDLPFTLLDGIVDTDTYTAPVNFPFTLNDITWEGLIPAGTPIAQVIPFKRESWKMEVSNDNENVNKITRLLRSKFFDSYKNQFWHRKEYK